MGRKSSATTKLHLLNPLFLRALNSSLTDCFVMLDEHGEPIFYNAQMLEFWNLDHSHFKSGMGNVRRELMLDQFSSGSQSQESSIEFLSTTQDPQLLEFELKNNRIVQVQVIPIQDERDKHRGRLVMFRDITEHRLAERQRSLLSQYDHGTGLLNRNSIVRKIDLAIANGDEEFSRFGLILIDLTDFKKVNERYGYVYGDSILSAIADRLYEACAPNLVARYGEDEFLVFTKDLGPTEIESLTQKLLEQIATIKTELDMGVNLAASAGISLFPKHGSTSEEITSRADIAMRHAKALGPGRMAFFTDQLKREHTDKQNMESRLPNAIANNELTLHYQPLISLTDYKIIGSEALIRWNCPDKGQVSPQNFLAYAEESGLIVEIGDWVLRTATKQAAKWQISPYGPIPVSVNVSAQQLVSKGFVESVQNALAASGLPAELLELELTETSFVDHLKVASETIQEIRNLGVKVSIDDFGTGYASLTYLKHFKVDTLKIDQSFTSGIGQSQSDDALVLTAISLAENLGLKSVAEGVETRSQLRFLEDHSCKFAQGFLFSKPVNADTLTGMLHNPYLILPRENQTS